MKKVIASLAIFGSMCLASQSTFSATIYVDPQQPFSECKYLPDWSTLQSKLAQAQQAANGGIGLQMWVTVVNRDGFVCAVAYTGNKRNDQWPGSRVISAQKANTANAFSLSNLALSTANLYTAVQPGGTLFGLQHSNPVDTTLAYAGPIGYFGTDQDPLVGKRVGGVNVFGGGLALYDPYVGIVGAIGVSGDTSCADHNIAWRTRSLLGLDHVPAGVSPDKTRPDNIVYDIHTVPGLQIGVSASGWGHPACNKDVAGIANSLPVVTTVPK
ncbi:heme-binding protein [Methylomonas sp. AM2-LC]|uniref:GlcG/HbpS family heme-binding protein n=1 Tax=Methylomonas sp. AM2-LC TaxID=3153301 RepID=UPI003265F548